MNLEQLLDAYGYPALFVGTFAEGETVLVLGSLLAQPGSSPTCVSTRNGSSATCWRWP